MADGFHFFAKRIFTSNAFLQVNMAARMEAHSLENHIHLSEQAAEALRQAGKSHWVEPRDSLIDVKGMVYSYCL